MADASRDRMVSEIGDGGSSSACASEDASSKVVLSRGCDPVMAQRAGAMLPPMIGQAAVIGVTTDDEFFSLLQERKFDVVFFAPGACRYSAAHKPIPGGSHASAGWTIADYWAKVREHQGDAAIIVETTEERQIVPLLRKALGLPPA
mmetsp:Transcript_13411/g.24020  ORF Transcript_13411/g.24020 Transcript_13411/m.24020 type:complete len:147 (+) Transcript_13411:98-538(+)